MSKPKRRAAAWAVPALFAVGLTGGLATHNQSSMSPLTRSAPGPRASSLQAVAPAVTTIDGVSLSAVPEAPSLAWALGLTHRTGVVLANDPLGLKLALLHYLPGPFNPAASAQLYQRYVTNDGREFNIAEWVVTPQYAAKRAAVIYGDRNGQNARDIALSLTDQGQTTGHYMEFPNNSGGAQPFRAVDVDTDILSIRLSGDGFSYDEFMTILNNLVDGHSHPAVAAHLQSELSASTYTVTPR